MGLEDIDKEHKNLINLLNVLANRIVLKSEVSEVNAAFEQLIAFTAFHFENEDKVWSTYLPQGGAIVHHKQEHDGLLSKINNLKDNFISIPEANRIEQSLEVLSRWLVTHLLKSDLYLATVVTGLQKGISLDEAQSVAKTRINHESQLLLETTLSAYKSLSETAQHLMDVRSQLEESEARLQGALTYAKIGYWEYPAKGDNVYWSEQIYQIFGLPEATPAGRESLCKIMPSSYHSAFQDSLKKSLETGSEHHVRYPITRPLDGEVRWIDCRGKVHYQSNGEPDKITGFIQDITEYRALEELNHKLAITDPLTGALNRRGFTEKTSTVYSASTRYDTPLTVMILDLDNFKRINDQYGHQHGDYVLQHFSEVCRNILRESDIFCRLGGEEFAVVLLNTPIEKGLDVAERIRSTVESATVTHDDIELSYTVSIGASGLKASDEGLDDAMQRADDALYRAKSLNKNRVECLAKPK